VPNKLPNRFKSSIFLSFTCGY